MTNFLQTAGTEAKQKKAQGLKPKNGENAGTNVIFKAFFFFFPFLSDEQNWASHFISYGV